jgi:hypothetical protein
VTDYETVTSSGGKFMISFEFHIVPACFQARGFGVKKKTKVEEGTSEGGSKRFCEI